VKLVHLVIAAPLLERERVVLLHWLVALTAPQDGSTFVAVPRGRRFD
jgi:hypothetical protein